jgi:uridine kinase
MSVPQIDALERQYELNGFISVYESMVLFLRTEVTRRVEIHVMEVGSRLDDMVKDYMDTRITAVESQLNVFEHVEALLVHEREQLDIEKHDLLITKLLSSLPLGTTVSASVSLSVPPSNSNFLAQSMR